MTLWISRCPYRVSLLGGGSDLVPFIRRHKFGASIGFSIKKYSYTMVALLSKDAKHGTLNYSSRENYKSIEEIAHPLIRAALIKLKTKHFVEITSVGIAAGGGGLGGSSSFLMSLLTSLSKACSEEIPPSEIIKLGADIEIEMLGKEIGCQDHYLCAKGGINAYKYEASQKVLNYNISKTKLNVIKRLATQMVLVPTHINRSADNVLARLYLDDQNFKIIKEIRSIALNFIECDSENESEIEELLHNCMSQSWQLKSKLSSTMTPELTAQLGILKSVPHRWIKLLGAGSGGYFLFCGSYNYDITCDILAKNGVVDAIPIEIDYDGIVSVSI